MSVTNREVIKRKFTNGSVPTETDFHNLLDSFIHVADSLERFISRATTSETEAGVDNNTVVTPLGLKTALNALVRLSELTGLDADVQSKVDTAIANLVGSASAAYDTLVELQGELQDNDSELASLLSMVNDRYTKSETDTKLAGKAASVHTHDDRYYTESEVNTKLAAKAASSHSHDDRYYTESEMNTKLAAKAASSHSHDDRYYTESEINTKLAAKAASTHTHTSSQVGLGNLPNSKSDLVSLNSSVTLATSKAVKTVNDKIPASTSFVAQWGKVFINDISNAKTITVNHNQTGAYLASGVFRSSSTSQGAAIYDDQLSFIVYDVKNNSFKVLIKDQNTDLQDSTYFDWFIIK